MKTIKNQKPNKRLQCTSHYVRRPVNADVGSKKMKITIQMVVTLALAANITGCATSGYWTDRKRDAADILTMSTGSGGGVMARVGPIGTGLGMHFPTGGLRGGDWLGDNFINDGTPFPRNSDGAILLVGGQEFAGTALAQERGKVVSSIMVCGIFLPCATVSRDSNIWIETRECSRTTKDGRVKCSVVPYLTQIEFIAGFGGTFHVGFNAGELVDFILGWTTLDIFGDDIEAKNQKARSNNMPQDTAHKLADPEH